MEAGPTPANANAMPEVKDWDVMRVVAWATQHAALGRSPKIAAALQREDVGGAALLELTSQEIKQELKLSLGLRKDLERAIADLKPTMNKRPRDDDITEGSCPPAHRQSSPPGGVAPSPSSTGVGACPMQVSGRRAKSQARRVKLGAESWHVESIKSVSGDTIEVKWEGFERTSEHSRASILGGAVDATKIQAMINACEEIGSGDSGGTEASPAQHWQEIVDLASADFSGALASHVMPGAPLGAFAMVCVEWWKTARRLETYTRSGFFASIWSPPQLVKYFQRLPELEPELWSPGLLMPSDRYRENGEEREAGAEHSWGSSWSAGDYDSAGRIYSTEAEVIQQICDGKARSPDEIIALWDEMDDSQGSTTWHRKVLRGNIGKITGAAIRRLARFGGVSHFSSAIYDEARGTLRRFLEAIQRSALTYSEHLFKRTVTSEDVARALELRALQPPVHSQPVETAGFFAVTKVGLSRTWPHPAPQDDLAHPAPNEIMPYLFAFGRLTEEIFQDLMVSQPSVILRACACSVISFVAVI